MKKQIAMILAMFLAIGTIGHAVHYDYLVFLDYDGVLNNSKSDITQLYVAEKVLLKRLKPFFQLDGKTGIVLSSTWRYTELTRTRAKKALKSVGLKTFFSCTPNFAHQAKNSRAQEIAWWLNNNTTNIQIPGAPEWKVADSRYQDELPIAEFVLKEKDWLTVKGFVILDDADVNEATDNTDLTREIGKHFVHVDKVHGLTEDDVNRAIKILTEPAEVKLQPTQLLMNNNNPFEILQQLTGH